MPATERSSRVHEHPSRAGRAYTNVVTRDNSRIHVGDVYNIPPRQSQSLDFGRLETRFLSIDSIPRVPGLAAEISCDLETKSLFESPGYVALSYSWGDHTATRPILLDGKITDVTVSLEVALKELVARGVEVVWVDALCIDQKNNYEKVYQLRQMGTIFSKAAKVVAWLGPAADESADAMKALSTMSEADDVDQHGPAILKLLQRPYWERVWIIQEIAKASKVEVWCGSQMLTWDVLIEGVQHWMSTSMLCRADFNHPITALKQFCDAERDSRRGNARMLLSTAMVRTMHAKATLRRDRIYALLGMTRDGTETVPTPNYVQDDATVFNRVLEHMIVEQGKLDLILLGKCAKKQAPSPSWLPVWTDEISSQVPPWISRCFDDSSAGHVAVGCQAAVLQVEGQILAKTQDKTRTNHAHQIVNGILYTAVERAQIHIYRIKNQILLCCALTSARIDRDDRQLRGAYMLAVFWSSPTDTGRARCPRLRELYTKNADIPYGHTTLRASVEEIQAEIRNGLDTFGYRFTAGGPRVSVPLDERAWDDLPQIWVWLEELEAAVEMMLRYGVELRSIERQGEYKPAMLPSSTREGDVIAWILGCTLPVVLREFGDGKYGLVGEVVEDWSWNAQSQRTRKNDLLERHGGDAFDRIEMIWYGVKDEELRTLYLA